LGFERAGVCRAHPPRDGEHLRQWLAEGRHGTMEWMERTLTQRLDPGRLLAGARSVLVVALNYAAAPASAAPSPRPPDAGDAAAARAPAGCDAPLARGLTGRVSIYARGRDYHRVLIRRLEQLRSELELRLPGCRTRVCVDTSPLLERYWAQAAGVGWVGKNTNLIVQGLGSWVFLGALLCDVDLGSEPPATERCGTCRRCLDACPTRAFDGAWRLDARRCVSYLTIEHRGEIDPALAAGMGDWVFGCDDCQTVCPWNRFALPTRVPEFEEGAGTGLGLDSLARLDEAQFDALTRGRGLRRAGRAGLRRNAIIALGNSADKRAFEPLRRALDDPLPALRRQAAHALARLALALAGRDGSASLAREAEIALRSRLESEADGPTRQDLTRALASLTRPAGAAACA
jgi:epoxyqueuosine reductase